MLNASSTEGQASIYIFFITAASQKRSIDTEDESSAKKHCQDLGGKENEVTTGGSIDECQMTIVAETASAPCSMLTGSETHGGKDTNVLRCVTVEEEMIQSGPAVIEECANGEVQLAQKVTKIFSSRFLYKRFDQSFT